MSISWSGASKSAHSADKYDHACTKYKTEPWAKKFQGIYATLAFHVLGEKIVLEELGYAVALQSDNLHVAEQAGSTRRFV